MKRAQELKDELFYELDVDVQWDGQALEVGSGTVVVKASVSVGDKDILFVVRESAVDKLIKEGLISVVRKSSMKRYVFDSFYGKLIIEAQSLEEAIGKLQPPVSSFFVEEGETGERFFVYFNESMGQWGWTRLRKRSQKRKGGAVK